MGSKTASTTATGGFDIVGLKTASTMSTGVGNTATLVLDGVHTLLAGGEASSSNNFRFTGDESSRSTIVFSNACISEDNFFGVSRTA